MDEYLNFSSNPWWVGDNEGIIFILLYNGQFYIVGADGDDTTESDNWLRNLGYPVTTLYTLEFSAVNGSVDKSVFVGEEDDTVTVTVTPDEGMSFIKWDDDNTDNPRTFIVGEDDEEYEATCGIPLPYITIQPDDTETPFYRDEEHDRETDPKYAWTCEEGHTPYLSDDTWWTESITPTDGDNLYDNQGIESGDFNVRHYTPVE